MICSGEIAYGAFRAHMQYYGNRRPLPEWASLSRVEQEAWRHAAQEAIDVHIAAAFA